MRKTKFADVNPRRARMHNGVRGISFECPEADGGCGLRHVVPGDRWTISTFEDLGNVTITPSIACSGACRMHIHVTNGEVTFCSDSKSGPDWEKDAE